MDRRVLVVLVRHQDRDLVEVVLVRLGRLHRASGVLPGGERCRSEEKKEHRYDLEPEPEPEHSDLVSLTSHGVLRDWVNRPDTLHRTSEGRAIDAPPADFFSLGLGALPACGRGLSRVNRGGSARPPPESAPRVYRSSQLRHPKRQSEIADDASFRTAHDGNRSREFAARDGGGTMTAPRRLRWLVLCAVVFAAHAVPAQTYRSFTISRPARAIRSRR